MVNFSMVRNFRLSLFELTEIRTHISNGKVAEKEKGSV